MKKQKQEEEESEKDTESASPYIYTRAVYYLLRHGCCRLAKSENRMACSIKSFDPDAGVERRERGIKGKEEIALPPIWSSSIIKFQKERRA